MRRGYVVALVMVLGSMLVPATAGASVFTVNTTADTAPATAGCAGAAGDCSLRQAIKAANANAGDDTINFGIPTPATIVLNFGDLIINPASSSSDALTINGPGAEALTVVGDGNTEVFHFTRGKNTLTGVTVRGGSQSSFNGAGINKRGGTLVLDSSVVTNNSNDAQNFQGAGGVLNVSGLMTIRNSTISNNDVTNADSGGGAGVVSHPGDIVIVNSTISGNSISGSGSNTAGGLWNAQGGGIMTLLNVTVSKNTSQNGPGGLENEGNKVRLANTIIAGNTTSVGTSPDCETFGLSLATTTSQGYNLIGSGDGCGLTAMTGDKVGTNASPIDPRLLPLALYGGPTPTMALFAGSPPLNGGNPAAVSNTEPLDAPPALLACRTTDQRGIVRPQLGTCDIGAYEYAPGEALATVPPCSSNGLVTVTVTPPQGGFAQAVRYKLDTGPEQRVTTTNNQAVVTVPAGQHTLTYWAESQGGDQELTQHTANVLVDPTPPVVTIRSDQRRVTYRRGQFASVTITASDSGSALTSNPSRRRMRISTSRLGRRTIQATAVDTCGNRATAAYTYRVLAQRSARKPARRRGGRPRFTG